MSEDRPRQDQDKYVLRMPDGMRDQLKAAAADNNRSLNAEIVARLERSVDLAKVLEDYARAEERLSEQHKTERELRRLIELHESVDRSRDELEHSMRQAYKSLKSYTLLLTSAIQSAADGDDTMLGGIVDHARTHPIDLKEMGEMPPEPNPMDNEK